MDGSSGGGPAPFLLKTYDMVDDSSTDEIVSWSSSMNSFVVWNPPEFACLLLPTYFKHNNFSSFIRQLNTYGFRKIDPERWEFANEEFVKDQKHLLKNIHRRRPIHSHSQPSGTSVDTERAAFEEEIDKISREKTALENNILRFKEQKSSAMLQLDDLTEKVTGMEQRQENLLTFLEKAAQNHYFVEQIARKLEAMDFSAYNKKRRLPVMSIPETTSFGENNGSSIPAYENISHQDFSNKLSLELSPSVSDINLVSSSTQSSSESANSQMRAVCLLAPPETLELSDTGTSFTLQQNLASNEEIDVNISCHLNLTLASSSLHLDRSQYPQLGHETVKSSEPRCNASDKEAEFRVSPRNRTFSDGDATLSSSKAPPNKNQGVAIPKVRVNDVFWEQFLTERPGATDTEEARTWNAQKCEEERGGYSE